MSIRATKEAIERLTRALPTMESSWKVVSLGHGTQGGIQKALEDANIPVTYSFVSKVGMNHNFLIFREDKQEEFLGLIETLQGLLLELENVLTLLPGETHETATPE